MPIGRPPKFSDEEAALIAEAYARGSSTAELAAIWKTTGVTIARCVRRAGGEVRLAANAKRAREKDGLRECIDCLRWLALDCFQEQKGYRLNFCRECRRERYKHLERSGAQDRVARLWYCFRLREDAYNALLKKQKKRCAACRAPFGAKTPHVDHDHACCPGRRSCGKCVRGLLCGHCNATLGNARDSVKRLRDCANYLENHAC